MSQALCEAVEQMHGDVTKALNVATRVAGAQPKGDPVANLRLSISHMNAALVFLDKTKDAAQGG